MSSDPAPLIVTALIGEPDFTWLDGLRRRHFSPERNHLRAHLTMFHHLPPSVEAELRRRLSEATMRGHRPRARIPGLIDLGAGVAYRVESPDLEAIRGALADAFADMLVPQDRAGWRPHVTIQNKVTRATAAATLKGLRSDFRPRPLAIAGLGLWRYRGGPWEAVSRYPFARP